MDKYEEIVVSVDKYFALPIAPPPVATLTNCYLLLMSQRFKW